MGKADHAGELHGGVLVESSLDLRLIVVRSADEDHVREPVGDADIPVAATRPMSRSDSQPSRALRAVAPMYRYGVARSPCTLSAHGRPERP